MVSTIPIARINGLYGSIGRDSNITKDSLLGADTRKTNDNNIRVKNTVFIKLLVIFKIVN
jgi:hypothetical protein